MEIIFNSYSNGFKSPFGCVIKNQNVSLRLLVKRRVCAMRVYLCVFTDLGQVYKKQLMWSSLEKGYDVYVCKFSLPHEELYFYNFEIITNKLIYTVKKDSCNVPCLEGGEFNWQITCYNSKEKVNEDFFGKVFYQIFPDRFNKSGNLDLSKKLKPFFIYDNISDIPQHYPIGDPPIYNTGFFGGNLKGIEEKIEYLVRVGISVIYLNPIFMAHSNHRYDTSDYLRIDPMLGAEKDFVSLCDTAHNNGIKIILDGVFSHTGDNSLYFDRYGVFNKGGAYNNSRSPYHSWYQWGENLTEYTGWWGIKTLPCTNEMDDGYLDFIVKSEDSVIKKWLRLGADGYRLDVADELPDEFIFLLKQECAKVKPNSIIIGEVWEDASNKISYGLRRKYLLGDELDSVMNYVYKDAIIGFIMGNFSAKQFNSIVMGIFENYPPNIVHNLMNSLSTHDTARILTVLCDDYNANLSKDEQSVFKHNEQLLKNAVVRLKAAMFLQFFLPGCPCVYYGDEIGMTGYSDPFNRAYFKWWDVNKDILSFTTELSKLKNTYIPLQKGDIKPFIAAQGRIEENIDIDVDIEVEANINNENVYGFVRRYEGEKVVCIINISDTPYTIKNDRLNCVFCSNDPYVLNKYDFSMYVVVEAVVVVVELNK